ncbi:MAG: M4 family metallopeptidase, partial [Polyangiaceae bacterium]
AWAAAMTSALLCSCQSGSTEQPNQAPPDTSSSSTPEERVHEQRTELEQMKLETVSFNRTGAVRLAQGRIGLALNAAERTAAPGQRGDRVLASLRKVLLAEGTEALTLRSNDVISPVDGPSQGYRTLRYAQSIRGIPVIGGEVSVGTNSSGEVDVVSSTFLPATGLPERPAVTADEAFETARHALEAAEVIAAGSFARKGEASLAYYGATRDADRARLVWVLPASYISTESADADEADIWVDAVDGTYVDRASHRHHFSPRVRVLAPTLPQGAPSPDAYPTGLAEINIGADSLATAARANIATTEQAWVGRGLPNYPPLDLVVHWGAGYSNGFFTQRGGINYITLGDGNSPFTRSPALLLDLVAHEYGHGVVAGIRPLTPAREAASINEAFGDISGVLTEASVFGLRDQTFEMFEDLYIDYARFPALPGRTSERSLNNPALRSVAASGDYYPVRAIDDGSRAVYFNTTIVGHAFKLMVTGGMAARAGQTVSPGAVVPTVNVTPIGLGTAVSVFETALRSPQALPDMTIPQLASLTENSLIVLDPTTRQAIHNAWVAVGVFESGCFAPPATPQLSVEDLFCNSTFRFFWNAVPGATTYFAEYVPRDFPWSLAAPAVDGPFNQCRIKLSGPSKLRLQACNACGCSAFTPDNGVLFPTTGCK